MKAITIQQPWAWAIAAGHKLVENRKIRTHYRGPIAIHAGKSRAWMVEGLAFLRELGIEPPAELVFGAVIATAELIDCYELDEQLPGINQDDHFASGPFCWQLANVRPLATPFPCRGQQGWFSVEIPEFSKNTVGLDTGLTGSLLPTTR